MTKRVKNWLIVTRISSVTTTNVTWTDYPRHVHWLSPLLNVFSIQYNSLPATITELHVTRALSITMTTRDTNLSLVRWLFTDTNCICTHIKSLIGSSIWVGLASGRASSHKTFAPQTPKFSEEPSNPCLAWKHGRQTDGDDDDDIDCFHDAMGSTWNAQHSWSDLTVHTICVSLDVPGIRHVSERFNYGAANPFLTIANNTRFEYGMHNTNRSVSTRYTYQVSYSLS